jgi:ADP-ribosylglycohydrolase
VTEIRDGGHWNTLAGQPTDDSEMALALARCLVDRNGFDRDAIARAYVAWGASGPFDMGGTTLAGLQALRGHGRPNCDSQSNGALMRVSPIGILYAGGPALAAKRGREDAALTHPNPICVAASAAFAAAIAAGIGGADHRTMGAVAYAHAGDDEGAAVVRTCLQQALEHGPRDFERQQGWVLIALGNAFHRLHIGQPLEQALVETVGLGGDTDTAICGALLGAAQGRDAIPLRWRRAFLACRTPEATGIRHPRPMAYWPDDALDLAEALLVAGTP